MKELLCDIGLGFIGYVVIDELCKLIIQMIYETMMCVGEKI